MPYINQINVGGSVYDLNATQIDPGANIDGVAFDGSADIIHYGVSSTAAGTVTKTVAISDFTLMAGARVSVKFTNADTSGAPKLNVTSTGAKTIVMQGSWSAGDVVDFVYDGTNWVAVRGVLGTDVLLKNTSATAGNVASWGEDGDLQDSGVPASEVALQDGYYEGLTAGAAESLTGRGDGVPAGFTFRTAGGDVSIADGTATINSLHGNTLMWNQLAPAAAPASNWAGYGGTLTTADDIISLTITNATASPVAIAAQAAQSPRIFAGRKYFMTADLLLPRASASASLRLGTSSGVNYIVNGVAVPANEWTTVSGLFTADTNVSGARSVTVVAGGLEAGFQVDDVLQFRNIMVLDLTAIFGAGNEPSTAEGFLAFFPLAYYTTQQEPVPLHYTGTGIQTVGFNQWDEDWEQGAISSTNGQDIAQSNPSYTNFLRGKNYTPAFPETKYHLACNISGVTNAFIFWYDADQNYLGRSNLNAASGSAVSPAGTRYLRFCVDGTNTYPGDGAITINLSWSGYRDGEHEAYWTQTRDLPVSTYFPNGMKSVAALAYDELRPDMAITRIAAVDMGTLRWTRTESDPVGTYRATLPNNALPLRSGAAAQGFAWREYTKASDIPDMCASGYIASSGNERIIARDTRYDDVSEFNVAQSGKLCYYILTEPTKTPIDPALNLSYRVSDFGTERSLPDNAATPTTSPLSASIVYGLNIQDTVRRLPQDYISKKSFDALAAELISTLGVTITAVYNDSNETYGFTIADNRALKLVPVPASATAAGTAGNIAIGGGYLYVCVTGGEDGEAAWMRVQLSSWS